MIGYIGYKILNNLLLKIVSSKQTPLLSSVGAFSQHQRPFYFDFSDATTHFGDRLFFLPLILTLVKNGYTVRLSDQDLVTRELLIKIGGDGRLDSVGYQDGDAVIIPKPSYLSFKHRYPECVLVDFTDDSVKQGVSDQLLVSFQKSFDLDFPLFHEFPDCNGKVQADCFLGEGGKFWLFSNYINSGRFRKFFVNEKKLYEKALNLKKEGYQVIHVGSEQDFSNDSHQYEFIDIDLRGKTTVTNLIDLIQCPNVFGVITYDNYLMHLAGLYKKTAYVLFRGRFFKKNSIHHLKYVNNTFFEDESKLFYL